MDKLVGRLKQLARENPNGFTVKIPECTPVTKGWVVAKKETQNSFGDEGLRKVIDVAMETTFLVGGWKNGKLYYWDAVLVTEDEAEAIALGKENEQLAIFSLDQLREVFL